MSEDMIGNEMDLHHEDDEKDEARVEQDEEEKSGGEGDFSCPNCTLTFSHQWHFRKHMKFVHHQSSFSRHITAFYSEDDSSKIISFDCKLCNEVYSERGNLNSAGEVELTCKHGNCSCERVFQDFFQFLTHHKRICTVTYHKSQSGLCAECGLTFKNQDSLLIHMDRFHLPPTDKSFKCDNCGIAFARRGHLNAHKVTHQSERRAQCQLCGAKFKTNSSLRTHLRRTHVEEKFECDQCGKLFKSQHKLHQHTDTHSLVATVPCPICQKMFKSKHNVEYHIYATHEKRRKPKVSKNRRTVKVDSSKQNEAFVKTKDL